MKKILSISLVFCLILSLILSMPLKAQALNELELSTGGTASKITYSQTSNTEEIRIFASSVQIVKHYVIPPEGSITYYRIGFEIAGVSVPKTVRFDVNKGTVKQIRLANLSDPMRTSVVVETTKKPDYTVTPASDGKSVILTLKGLNGSTPANPSPSSTPKPSPTPSATPKPSTTPKPSATPIPATSTPKPGTGTNPTAITQNGPLSWTMSGDTCMITLNGISLSQTTIGNVPRFELREKEKLLLITIPGKDSRFKDGLLSGNAVIYGMLVNYNQKQNCTVIRISYHNSITFTHAISNGSSVIKVKSSNTTVPVTSGTPTPAPTTPTPTPVVTPKPSDTQAPTQTPNPSSPVPGTTMSFDFGTSSVNVSASNITGAKVYRLGNPSRIIMELSGTAAALDKIMPSGSLYNRVKVTQSSSQLVKVELFTENLPEWALSQSSGKINLALLKTDITNIQGGNGDNNVALRLVSPGIVNRYRQYSDSVILDDSVADGAFTYMIPSSIVSLGNGFATTGDGLTKSVTSYSTQQSSFLMLNKVDPNKQFKIVEGSSPDELLIVVATSEGSSGNNNSKLVVLDPGHGGSDPGGTVGSYYEKVYNLDIALKCEAILKASGINVVMTRTTDVFVGLEERANFANDRNASLFVSIHNNIMPTGYKGSMTLYYPSSYDGKAYAQIMQNYMVKDLKTNDLGLRARGDVTVIKKTKMPAILAEIACMSYPDDLNLLNNEAFRQKAAESLARSIIEIMSKR